MKVKKLEIFQNKIGLKGCKWSSLKATGTETPLPHPFLRESLVLRARPSLFELCGRRFAERFTVEVTFQEKTVGRWKFNVNLFFQVRHCWGFFSERAAAVNGTDARTATTSSPWRSWRVWPEAAFQKRSMDVYGSIYMDPYEFQHSPTHAFVSVSLPRAGWHNDKLTHSLLWGESPPTHRVSWSYTLIVEPIKIHITKYPNFYKNLRLSRQCARHTWH